MPKESEWVAVSDAGVVVERRAIQRPQKPVTDDTGEGWDAASGLFDHISFVSTSEACGFAKPDVRCFEHTASMAKSFAKAEAIVVGDRLEADILGANRYGIESCWFNPGHLVNASEATPTYEVVRLPDILPLLKTRAAS